jgi:Fe-S cluster biogenesis protein NfuA
VSAIARRVSELDALLRAHAGGLELCGVDDEGGVTVRYTGMCTGCAFRPVTAAATVRPGLMELDEVASVTIAGSRISEAAEQRLAAALAPSLERRSPQCGRPRTRS